jgi:hypothetical protein
VLDLDSMTELAAVPVGRDPVDDDGPRHVLFDRRANALQVLLSYPVVADSPHAMANAGGPRSGYLASFATGDLRPLGELRLEASPSEMAFSADGSALAVVHYDTARALANTTELDARRATLALVTPAALGADAPPELSTVRVCVAPAAVVFAGEAGLAFIACTGEDSLAAVDTVNRSVLSRVPAGSLPANKPYALTRSPSGETLALSNQVARTVVLFEARATPERLAEVQLAGVPFFAAWPSETELLVPVQDPSGVVRVDVATAGILQSVTYPADACEKPSDVRIARDGRVFLVCEGDHYRSGAVLRLEPRSLEVLGKARTGVYPDRLELLEP